MFRKRACVACRFSQLCQLLLQHVHLGQLLIHGLLGKVPSTSIGSWSSPGPKTCFSLWIFGPTTLTNFFLCSYSIILISCLRLEVNLSNFFIRANLWIFGPTILTNFFLCSHSIILISCLRFQVKLSSCLALFRTLSMSKCSSSFSTNSNGQLLK